MEDAYKEIDQGQSALSNLQLEFDVVEEKVNELEESLRGRDLLIIEERGKSTKIMEETTVLLVSKDLHIEETNEDLTDLRRQLEKQDQGLNQEKAIVLDTFQLGFCEAEKQAKHFFADEELNFNLLDSSRFPGDILIGGTGETDHPHKVQDVHMVEGDQLEATQDQVHASSDALPGLMSEYVMWSQDATVRTL